MKKACMVTGHRTVDPSKINYVKAELRQEARRAIEDGYTHFISGFAEGVDLWFASIVAELMNSHTITMEAALSYRKGVNSKDPALRRLVLFTHFFLLTPCRCFDFIRCWLGCQSTGS